MSNFIEDCINAEAILDEIDDYVEEWHNSNTNIPVYEFLGMTEDEYFLWVENDSYLKYIIEAHVQNREVNDIISDAYHKMVARTSSAKEAEELLKWLSERGIL